MAASHAADRARLREKGLLSRILLAQAGEFRVMTASQRSGVQLRRNRARAHGGRLSGRTIPSLASGFSFRINPHARNCGEQTGKRAEEPGVYALNQ